MIIGALWDQFNLTPWVYDLKKDTWSNKLNGEALPSLPNAELDGTAIFVENKVYLGRGETVFVLDLTTP